MLAHVHWQLGTFDVCMGEHYENNTRKRETKDKSNGLENPNNQLKDTIKLMATPESGDHSVCVHHKSPF